MQKDLPLSEATIAPTKVFIRYHGNYCGPGNRGGIPIDALDRACFKHDVEYDRSYGELPADAKLRKIVADRHFIARAMKIANDPTITPVIRKKALVAAKYFEQTIKIKIRLRRNATRP